MRLQPLMTLSLFFVLGITPVQLWSQVIAAQLAPSAKPAAAPVAAKGVEVAQPASTTTDPKAADLLALRQSSQAFVTAFNKGDAKAVAALWAKDGDYIDEAGRTYTGREAIEQEYATFFAAHQGIKIQVFIDSLRLLSPTAAIEDGRAMVSPAPAGAPGTSKYTAVHVKVDGVWQISTIRDTRVESPTGYHHVADLEWLIGTWIAEEHGGKLESVCQWVANKSFVQRNYTSTHADGTVSTGVQLIGFNPQAGHVQSWNFSSDGGLAIGVWTPRENGWAAELSGMLGDGTPTSAVILLTRLDDGAYAWQSVNRSAGNVALPDTDEVIMKRSAAE